MAGIQEIIESWSDYLKTAGDWEALVESVHYKITGCGLVYELPNPIDRPAESFAIADMRALEISEPHHHKETEIYFVLQGTGKIAVGDKIYDLTPGTNVVIPPDVIHITLPVKDLVLAVVNTPPFNPNSYIALSPFDPTVAKMIANLKSQMLSQKRTQSSE